MIIHARKKVAKINEVKKPTVKKPTIEAKKSKTAKAILDELKQESQK